MKAATVGPVERAAQLACREIADVLDKQAARLETFFRQLLETEGYRERSAQDDHAPHTVAFDCAGQCELTAESLREEARQLRVAAAETPLSLCRLAEKLKAQRSAVRA